MTDTTFNYLPTLSQVNQPDPSNSLKPASQPSTEPAPDVTKATPVVKADQTSLSSASSLLRKALTVSDVRTEKVASLQKAIASGSYHVSSSDVADKLLTSLLG
jgi:negative regulator of flagellin synthesis FlgM